MATKRHILFMLAVIWLLLTLLYLSMFSMFTYTTEPAHQRLVAGFICLPEIKQIPDYAVKCPFLGGEELVNGRFEPTKFWYPWTVYVMQTILASVWMAAFLIFSGLVGTFISFQRRVRGAR